MFALWTNEGGESGCHATLRRMLDSAEPFIGSEALARAAVSRHQLRTQYCAVLPNVYVSRRVEPSLEQRIAAAGLWSKGIGIFSGSSAAALHGAKWIPRDIPIKLIYNNSRPPQGVLTRRYTLLDGETQRIDGRLLTTPERTAFDIGRREAVHSAVAQLDALVAATGLKIDDVLCIAKCHPRAPGLRQLENVLELVDPGAQSPRESYLRLLLIEAGFPPPQTQIPVLGTDGIAVAYIDLGWREYMVGVEYEGGQHQTDRRRYVYDIHRLELVEERGWLIIRVVSEDGRTNIVRRVGGALAERGWTAL